MVVNLQISSVTQESSLPNYDVGNSGDSNFKRYTANFNLTSYIIGLKNLVITSAFHIGHEPIRAWYITPRYSNSELTGFSGVRYGGTNPPQVGWNISAVIYGFRPV